MMESYFRKTFIFQKDLNSNKWTAAVKWKWMNLKEFFVRHVSRTNQVQLKANPLPDHLRFRRWTGAEATCCSSAGTTVKRAAGCGCSQRPPCPDGSRAGCLRGWAPPCRSWREAAPAGQKAERGHERRRHAAGGRGRPSRTQSLWRLINRSMSSLILRYFSSDSGLWPAESSASMSGLSQPFKPFLRSVWLKRTVKCVWTM